MAAYAWGEQARGELRATPPGASQWSAAEVALVYTGVAGLLSILAILDVLVRADPAYQRESSLARNNGHGTEAGGT